MSPTPSTVPAGTESQAWLRWFTGSNRLFEEMERCLQAEAGIGLGDFVILSRLAEADENGMRMGEVADSVSFSRSRISHAVDRLEELGWVERRHCPTDRRGAYAALTPEGREKLGEAAPGHAEVVRTHLTEVLSPEETTALSQIVERVRRSLGGDGPDPGEP